MQFIKSTISCVDAAGNEYVLEIHKPYEVRTSFEGSLLYPLPWRYLWNGQQVKPPVGNIFTPP